MRSISNDGMSRNRVQAEIAELGTMDRYDAPDITDPMNTWRLRP